MTDHYTRALNLIDDMLHMMDQRPDGPQSAWYKAAWALMQEKPNRGLVYQFRRGSSEWQEINEAEYQFVLSRADVTGAELRILHTAPPAQVLDVRCPHCFGSGVMPKAAILPEPPDVKCRNCNGSGRLAAQQQKEHI